jgi:two-component system, OmpR family, osmolarity sensor histidine kinase EnvZ
MSRWLPRSLFGRNLLLIVGLILGAEVAIAVAFHVLVQMPRIERMAETTRNYLGTLSVALAHMDETQRRDFIASLDAQRQPVLLVRAQPENITRPASPLVRLALARLQRRLGDATEVAWSEQPQPRFWLRQQVVGETWWLGIDAGGLAGGRVAFALGVMLAAGLLAALGAVLIQRSINRPLRDLADAADRLAAGEFPAVASAGAPSEIARLAGHFERMARQLEAGERERALMLAGISHDLRTPLAKLRLAVEILDVAGEEELLEGMVRNIAAADQVIDQFIDFARLGEGEAAVLCDVEELVRDVLARYGSERLRLTPPPAGLVPCCCRPVALRRALANLVDNALKYSGSAVQVAIEQGPQELALVVTDHGPGIPDGELARLRQPFARLDAARSGPAGAGLGLAIVERIVRLEGGCLELFNAAGLVARIVLPRRGEAA